MSEKITVLRVGAKRNGYRRAGLLFGEAAACIPLSSLTSHQVKELMHDRMLQAERVDVVVVVEAELASLREKRAIADELVALLPSDFTWTHSPVEYVANVVGQLRVQTERANDLKANRETLQAQLVDAQARNESLRAQLAEAETKLAAKPETAKSGHATGRR